MAADRPRWRADVERAWTKAPIVWLSGVRRVGKTTLGRSFPGATYLNCDLPTVQERLREPEAFFREHARTKLLVLDEVHQLEDPSRLLKIGADLARPPRILATGSSTLAATSKFRDSLTGRKRNVQLVPVLWEELERFGVSEEARLLRGGLPPALLAPSPDPSFYAEWLDSYFARDIQELFRIEKRAGFLALLQALLKQSGGLVEVTKLGTVAGISRPTVMKFLDALEVTHAVRVVRPFHGSAARELVHQPKVYGFDTGFVCFARGWDTLRPEDHGVLWEHVVLETLTTLPVGEIRFWRDKSQREVAFVVARGRNAVDAIECKWSASGSNVRGLQAMREAYPKGENFVVVPHADEPYERTLGGLTVTTLSLADLARRYGEVKG